VTLGVLGFALAREGDWMSASVVLLEVSSRVEAVNGKEFAAIIRDLIQAKAVEMLGNPRKGEELLADTLARGKRLLGEDHFLNMLIADILMRLLEARNAFAAEEPLLRTAVAQYRRLCGPKSPQVGHTLSDLGWCVLVQGRNDESLALLEEAATILEDRPRGDDLRCYAHCRLLQGHIESMRGHFAKAERYWRAELSAVQRRARLGEVGSDRVADALERVCVAVFYQDDPTRRRVSLLELLEHLRRTTTREGPDLAPAFAAEEEGRKQFDRGDYQAARDSFQKALTPWDWWADRNQTPTLFFGRRHLLARLTASAAAAGDGAVARTGLERLRQLCGQLRHNDTATADNLEEACVYAHAADVFTRAAAGVFSAEEQKWRDRFAEQAVQRLRAAVARDYRNATWLENEPELRILHPREDFQKLLAEVRQLQARASN
jgi:tetratricopeptide (TPR) repeat protein